MVQETDRALAIAMGSAGLKFQISTCSTFNECGRRRLNIRKTTTPVQEFWVKIEGGG